MRPRTPEVPYLAAEAACAVVQGSLVSHVTFNPRVLQFNLHMTATSIFMLGPYHANLMVHLYTKSLDA